MFISPKQALSVALGLMLTIVASIACTVTINPAQVTPGIQPIPVTQIIPVVQPVLVTQVVPVTRVAEATPVLSGPKVILTRLQVSYLG